MMHLQNPNKRNKIFLNRQLRYESEHLIIAAFTDNFLRRSLLVKNKSKRAVLIKQMALQRKMEMNKQLRLMLMARLWLCPKLLGLVLDLDLTPAPPEAFPTWEWAGISTRCK
jgi:hypothetical protein